MPTVGLIYLRKADCSVYLDIHKLTVAWVHIRLYTDKCNSPSCCCKSYFAVHTCVSAYTLIFIWKPKSSVVWAYHLNAFLLFFASKKTFTIHFKYNNTFRSVLEKILPLVTVVKGLPFKVIPVQVFCEGTLTIRKYPRQLVTIILSLFPTNIKQERRNVQVWIPWNCSSF